MDFDVIVIGGGISGSIAAIAAAREGAKTLLVERFGFLGGTLTACGVGPMMTFHAGEKQVVRGIPEEIICRLKRKGLSPGHLADTVQYTATVTPFDNEGLKTELEEMLLKSGAKILYHTMLAGVEVENGSIKGVSLCGKTGMLKLQAKVYIDATGDADLSNLSGVKCSVGRESDGKTQAVSMMVRVNNVDIEKTRTYMHMHPEEFPGLLEGTAVINQAPRLGAGGFVGVVAKAKKAGVYSLPGPEVLFFEGNTPGEVIINTSRIYGYDTLNPWQLSQAEITGRQQANEIMQFFKMFMPGFEQARMMFTGPFLGVRSSRQIQGDYVLSDEDLMQYRTFSDAIAYSGYPVDIHSPDGALNKEQQKAHLMENKAEMGTVRQLPYRCLTNPVIHNLLTVGRCISVSYRAQGAFRTAPIAGAVGQAGGVAAVLAVKQGTSVRNVEPQLLRQTIKAQGGYIE